MISSNAKIQYLKTYIHNTKNDIDKYINDDFYTLDEKASYILRQVALIRGLYYGLDFSENTCNEKMKDLYNDFQNYVMKLYKECLKRNIILCK